MDKKQIRNIVEYVCQLKHNYFIHKNKMGYNVTCCKCGELHNIESVKYLSIVGNILVGIKGGIIGDNLDTKNNLNGVTIVCRKESCINKLFKDVMYKGK